MQHRAKMSSATVISKCSFPGLFVIETLNLLTYCNPENLRTFQVQVFSRTVPEFKRLNSSIFKDFSSTLWTPTWSQLNHQTKRRKEVRLISPSWCRLMYQKCELFFVERKVKNQWIALVGYLTISKNVSCYQTRCQ